MIKLMYKKLYNYKKKYIEIYKSQEYNPTSLSFTALLLLFKSCKSKFKLICA